MLNVFDTDRLVIRSLTTNDCQFIFDLVNTTEWKTFIGNRNVDNLEQSKAYIGNILSKENIKYWVVDLKETKNAIGIITFIKRDYLTHFDIGFAFLPSFFKMGYAFEAANTVLQYLFTTKQHKNILATTVKTNINSIGLLTKLGFKFDKEIINNNEVLFIYKK